MLFTLLLISISSLLYMAVAVSLPDDLVLSEDEWRWPQATFSSGTEEREDLPPLTTAAVSTNFLRRQTWAVCEAFAKMTKCTVDRYPPYKVDCIDDLTPFNFEGLNAGMQWWLYWSCPRVEPHRL